MAGVHVSGVVTVDDTVEETVEVTEDDTVDVTVDVTDDDIVDVAVVVSALGHVSEESGTQKLV